MSIKQNNKHNNRNLFGIGKNKKKILFIISLIASIIIENSIILYAPAGSKFIYTNWILLINLSLAAIFSILLVINIALKQKFLDSYLKIHIALAIGLILWLCANIQWIIYLLEEVDSAIPNFGDFFWITAYPFLGYSLFFTFKKYYKKYLNKKLFFISFSYSLLVGIYTVYIANIRFSYLDNTLNLVMISYTILNTILIIPAIVMFISFKKEVLLARPHMLQTLLMVNLVLIDNCFTIFFWGLQRIELVWISFLFIVNNYLIISAGLLWSLSFLHPIRYRLRAYPNNR